MGTHCTIKTETCGAKCTEWNGILNNGKNAWDEIKRVVKTIPCDTCKEEGLKNVSGLQDHTNVSLGEPPFDKNNYRNFVNKVNCVFDECKKSGRC